MSQTPVQICILHAPGDAQYLKALAKQLAPAERAKTLTFWHRDRVEPGASFWHELDEKLRAAQLIVELLSPDFLAECDREMLLAQSLRHPQCALVPVLCRPTVLTGSEFAELVLLPPGSAPISKWRHQDQAWIEVASALMKIVDRFAKTPGSNIPVPPTFQNLKPAKRTAKHAVLVIAASPYNGTTVDVGHEVKEIRTALRTPPVSEHFELIEEWSVDIQDIPRLLLRHQPTILHLSGHGTKDGLVVLEDGVGNGTPVPAQAFVDLLGTLNRQDVLRCVVLNACYTSNLAEKLSKVVSCVVAPRGTISSPTAAAFSGGFYSGLAAGVSFQVAFEVGCARIGLLSRRSVDLQLYCREGFDPATDSLLSHA